MSSRRASVALGHGSARPGWAAGGLAAVHIAAVHIAAVHIAAALLLVGLCSGCTSDAKRAEQGQVSNLAERIDRLRRAENSDKRPLLEQLARAECKSPDACALKDLCVRAYQLHQRGLDAIASLRSVAERDAGAGLDVSARLQTAERDLAHARELAERCSEEQVRVVRKTLL